MSATPQESWVALLEDKQLVELMFDRPDQSRIVGDIFLGRVEAVLPGIQAAFVDIGTEKAGFLHVSDLNLDDDELDDDDNGNGNGNGGGRRGRRSRKLPSIQEHIQRGQQILVQATKEPISTKGPRLTAQVSLPGRFLVYMPYSSHVGVSRKIEGRDQRSKLRKMAKEVLPRDSGGIIVRTVSEEVTQKTLQAEFKRLHEMWKKIQRRAESSKAPATVHQEAKLVS
ncbi:MAG TPA: ribonuclease E/G, partial [Longimicrobiales bacterium]|nr:ribonuclease E/G [Longimicrobiales bacterium]